MFSSPSKNMCGSENEDLAGRARRENGLSTKALADAGGEAFFEDFATPRYRSKNACSPHPVFRRAVEFATATIVSTLILAGLPAPSHACTGDCDSNGQVAINELVRMVNIALGVQPLDACPAADASGDGAVRINELVLAVGNALNGCPATATPTMEPSATPTIEPSATATTEPSETPTIEPSATATTPPSEVAIEIGAAVGRPGGTVEVEVRLVSGTSVAGTENDVLFGADVFVSEVPIGSRTCRENGSPCVTDADCGFGGCKLVDCEVNPGIAKDSSIFSFLPFGCSPGIDCLGVGTLVLSIDNTDVIPSGSVLYTCRMQIAADAALGTSVLACVDAGAASPQGDSLSTACADGSVEISGSPVPTATPTRTDPAPSPTATHTLPPSGGARIEIGSAAGVPGGTVEIEVRLASNTSVAGVENDIFFGPGVFVPEVPIGSRTCRRNGSPCITDTDCFGRCKIVDCDVNPALGREATDFGFLPGGCTPGVECTGLSTLVLSFDNISPIPNGSVLYTCRLQIASAAPVGNSALACAGAGAADPGGNSVSTACVGGSVQISGSPAPTVTPTPTGSPGPSPTATHTLPPSGGARIEIGSAAGVPGGTVEIEVRLASNTSVAGVENDIFFGPGVFVPEVPIGSRTCRQGGSPCITDTDCFGGCKIVDCDVNPALGREATHFGFLPGGCTPGVDCTGLSTLVLSFDNISPIPNGSVLYTCRLQIAADAPIGNSSLSCSGAGASSPQGDSVSTACVGGSVQISGSPAPTVTPTPTGSPGPSATATATSPPGPSPTATHTLPPSGGARIEIGSAAGVPGGTVEIEVRLASNTSVAGTENDITFGPGVFVPEVPIGSRTCRRNGSPCVTDADCIGECKIEDCEVNPALVREASLFRFLPNGCTPGVDCTGLDTLVLSFQDLSPIPNGAVLYTCRVQIAADAPIGNSTLSCSGAGAGSPQGDSVASTCVDGSVQINGF